MPTRRSPWKDHSLFWQLTGNPAGAMQIHCIFFLDFRCNISKSDDKSFNEFGEDPFLCGLPSDALFHSFPEGAKPDGIRPL